MKTMLRLFAALFLLIIPARAADLFWTGAAGNANWSSNANWSTATVPANGDSLNFGLAVRQICTNNLSNLAVAYLQFTNGGFVLNGTTGLTVTNGITNKVAGTASIGMPLTFPVTSAVSVAAGGSVTFSGPVTNATGLSFTDSGAVTFSNAIVGSGYLTTVGTGAVTLAGSAANTYTGATTITGSGAGAAQFILAKNSDVVAVPGDIFMSAAGTRAIVSAASNNQFGAGTVMRFTATPGDTRLEIMGSTQTLAGVDNTGFTGAYAAIQHRELGTPAAVDALSTLVLNVPGTNSYIFGVGNAVVRDQGGTLELVKTGSGTQTLTGNGIDYTGATLVNQGRLILLNNDDTWTRNYNVAAGATVEVNRDTATVYEHQYNGFVLNGGGTFEKTGTGIVDINANNNGAVSMSSGALIDVKAGTLRLGNGARTTWATNRADLNIASGAVFDMWDNVSGVYVDSLTGSGTFIKGTAYNTPGAGTLTVGVDGGSGTFTGKLVNGTGTPPGILSLTKSGSGTQTLSGTNTYTGATIVSNGVLKLAATGLISSSTPVRVVSGAMLDVSAVPAFTLTGIQTLQGSGTVTGNVATAAGSTIDPGYLIQAGTLTFKNNLTLTATSTNVINLATATTPGSNVNDQIVVNGDLDAKSAAIRVVPLAPLTSGGTYVLVNYTGNKLSDFNTNVLGNTTRNSWTMDLSTTNQVNMVVGGSNAVLQWAGAGSDWDIGTSSNWFDLGTANANNFYDMDTVVFDDYGSVLFSVNLVGALRPASVVVTNTADYIFGGPGLLADASPGAPMTLLKLGTAALIVSNANTFSGGTTVSNGTLQLAGNSVMGTGPITLATTAVALINLNSNTVANAVGGSGYVVKLGGGTTTMTGTNTYSGATVVSGGTLAIGGAGLLGGGAYAGAISNDANFIFGSSASQTLSGAISGVGSLSMTGAGTLTLAGSVPNTYTGLTTVSGSGNMILSASPGAAAIPGHIAMPNASSPNLWMTTNNLLGGNGILTFTGASGNARFYLEGTTQTLAGVVESDGSTGGVIENSEPGVRGPSISTPGLLILNGSDSYSFSGYLRNSTGTLGLMKTGSGTQTLAGANVTYTGPTTFTNGTLTLLDTTAFASAIAMTNGTTLELNRTANAFANRKQIAGTALSGNGVINVNCTTAGIGGGWIYVGGASGWNFGGTINVNSGVLTRDNTTVNNITGSATVNVASGGIFGTRGGGVIIGALNGAGEVSPIWSSANATTLTLGNGDGSGTFTGVIHGNGTSSTDGNIEGGTLALVKIGAGVETLSGNNTYTGTTTIAGGTLALGATGSISNTPSITLSAGTAFDVSAQASYTLYGNQTLQGYGTVTGNVATAAGTRIIPGDALLAGTLAMNGNLTLAAGTTNFFNLTTATTAGAGVNDLIAGVVNLDAGGSTIQVVPGGALTGPYTLFTYTGTYANTFNVPNTTRFGFVVDTNTPNEVRLALTGTNAALRWSGLATNLWDVTTTTNWYDIAAATNGAQFYNADSVLFDDSVGVKTNVTIVGTVYPASTTIATSTNQYTLTGTLGGGPVTKSGSALAILASANTYSGGTVLEGGSLQLSSATSLGLGSLYINTTNTTTNTTVLIPNAISVMTPMVVRNLGTGTPLLRCSSANGDGNNGNNRLFVEMQNRGISIGGSSDRYSFYNSGIVGTGDVTYVTVSGQGRTTMSGMTNTYVGTTHVAAGAVLQGDGSEQIPDWSVLDLNGQFWMNSSSTETVDALTGTGLAQINTSVSGNHTLIIGAANGSGIFYGTVQIGGTGTRSLTLVKTGTGTQTLAGTGDNSSLFLVSSNGLLVLDKTNSASAHACAQLTISGGTVRLAGTGDDQLYGGASGYGLTFNSGLLDMNGRNEGVDLFTGTGGVITNSQAALVTWTSGQSGGSSSFGGSIVGNIAYTKAGAGTQTLTGTNTYTGPTTVNAGRLALAASGSIAATPSITVVSPGTFDVTSNAFTLGAGQSLRGTGFVAGSLASDGTVEPGATVGTLTVGSYTQNVGATLNIDLGGAATYDRLAVSNTAVLNGTLNVLLANSYLPAGTNTFTILTASNVTGTFSTTNNLLANGLSLDVQYTPTSVVLTVVGSVDTLTWRPTAAAAWNLTSSNWYLTAAAVTDVYKQGSIVIFDDTGAYSNNVNLVLPVLPASLTVNSSSNYDFSGAGGLIGTMALTKSGAGTLTISTTNNFTGAIAINGGKLTIGGAGNLGGNTYAGLVTNNGVFAYNSSVTQTNSGLMSGTGSLVKGGASTLMLTANNTYAGTTTINGGTLLLSGNNYAYSGGTIFINGSSTLKTLGSRYDFLGKTFMFDGVGGGTIDTSSGGNFVFALAANVTNRIVTSGGVRNNIIGTTGINIGGDATDLTIFDITRGTDPTSDLTVAGPLSNGAKIQKVGNGILTLGGANSYSGGTTISAGTLALGSSGSISASLLLVQAGGTFDVSGRPGYTLNNGQILYGRGTVTGDVQTANGAQIRPDGLTSVNTLTFKSALRESSGTTNYFDLTSQLGVGGGTNDLVVVAGRLEPSNAVVSINQMSPVASGNYTLFTHDGTKTTFFNPTIAGAVTGRKGWSLDETTTPTAVQLVVTGAYANLTWKPTVSQVWDASASNWLNGATSAADRFFDLDTVLFSDLGGASNVALLSGTLQPASVTVNSASNYFFGGTGLIGGIASLTKDGVGTLTISNANTFSGIFTISSGTVSVAADTALGAVPGSTIANQLTINGGTLKATAGATFSATRGITIGAAGGTLDTASQGTGNTTTFSGPIAGTGALTLRSNGDMSPSGGGASGLGIKLNNTANSFVGDVTILSGLVAYAGNGAFGDATNKIVLNGGGLLDNNVNLPLSRTIQVLSGGGTFRLYGSTTVTWSGPITGSGNINRTDSGTLTLAGSLAGYSGTYSNQGGTTVLADTTTGTIPGNWAVAGGALTLNSTTNQTFGGLLYGAGTLNKYNTNTFTFGVATNNTIGAINLGGGTLVVGSGAALLSAGGINATFVGTNLPISLAGSGIVTGSSLTVGNASTLNVGLTGPGAIGTVISVLLNSTLNLNSNGTLTAGYIHTADASGANNGVVNQNAGTLILTSANDADNRLAHWPTTGNIYNLSGGTLTCTNSTFNNGWDGQSTFAVSGGTANLKGLANGASGHGGGSSLTIVLTAGSLNIGVNGITQNGAAAKAIYLGGGTLGALATWSASPAMTLTGTNGNVTVNTAGNTITLSGQLSGAGGLTKTGTGALILSATTNTYAGEARVAGGELRLQGVYAGGTTPVATNAGTLTVNGMLLTNALASAGGTISGTGSITGTVTADALGTVGNGSGASTAALSMTNLVMNDGSFLKPFAITSGAPLRVTATDGFTMNGVVTVLVQGVVSPGVTYTLLDYSSSSGYPSGTGSLVLGKLPSHGVGYLTTNVAATTIELVVTNTEPIHWLGLVNNAWDTDVTTNFEVRSTLEFTTFLSGDNVLFDDNALSNFAISVGAPVNFSLLTVSNETQNYNFSGVGTLGGSGGLVKQGAAALTITSTNIYTGPTTISGGTLTIGGTSVLGGGTYAAAITNNGVLVLASPIDQTLNGIVSGVGTVTKTGSGYLYLGANNPLTGPINLLGGVVRQNVGTTFSTSTAMTVSNAALEIRYGSYSVNWLDVGSLTLAGGAILRAAPQYQIDNGDIGFLDNIAVVGSNTVSATGGSYGKHNWLSGGMNGDTNAYVNLSGGAGYGAYADRHAIILSGGGWSNYLGTINAANDVTINGTVDLRNAKVTDAGTFGFYANNAVAEFGQLTGAGLLYANGKTGGEWKIGNLGTSTSFAGAIDGASRLTKVGAGTLTLTSTNHTYTGSTTVSNGLLLVNGTINSSAVIVASGGTLGGTGAVGAAVAAGTVSPGASGIGRLNVAGVYTQQVTGKLSIEINGTTPVTDYDVLAVGGTAVIGGTLQVTNMTAVSTNDSFTILTAGTVDTNTSLFTVVGAPATDLVWTVTYTPTTVVLRAMSAYVPPVLTGYDAFSNQFALAGGPLGDANGDGWLNLAEYALGFDPTGTAHSGLSGGIVSGKLSLTFDVLDSRSDITYWAETSDTLMTNDSGWSWIWTNKPIQTLAGPNATVLGTSGETNTVRVSDTAAGTNRFLRLRITRP